MSNASKLRARGFTQLLADDSESLLFNGVTLVHAVVDRSGRVAPVEAGQVQFTERSLVVVEVLKSAVGTAPGGGDFFDDEAGQRLFVESTSSNGESWLVNCRVQNPT